MILISIVQNMCNLVYLFIKTSKYDWENKLEGMTLETKKNSTFHANIPALHFQATKPTKVTKHMVLCPAQLDPSAMSQPILQICIGFSIWID